MDFNFQIESDDPQEKLKVRASEMYLKQLTNILVPSIYEGFQSLYNEAVEFKETTKDPRFDDYSELQMFKDYVRKIPKWTQDTVDKELQRIIAKSNKNEKFLNRLLGAVFYSQAMIMSVIRTQNPTGEINLKIPKFENFLKQCYVEARKEIYTAAYLFYEDDETTTIEKRKNIDEIQRIIHKGITSAIETLLPTEEIMKKYLGKMFDDDTDNSSVTSGIQRELFRDFAQNTVRQKLDKMLSDKEEESSTEQKSSKESTRAEEKQEEIVVEQNKVEVLEEEVKIENIPDPILETPPFLNMENEIKRQEEEIKEIVNKQDLVIHSEPTDTSITQENIKKIIQEKEHKHHREHRHDKKHRHHNGIERNKHKERRHREERERRREQSNVESTVETVNVENYTNDTLENHRVESDSDSVREYRNEENRNEESRIEVRNEENINEEIQNANLSDDDFDLGGPEVIEEVF